MTTRSNKCQICGYSGPNVSSEDRLLESFVLDKKIKRKSEIFQMREEKAVKKFNQRVVEINKKMRVIGNDSGVKKAFANGLLSAFGEEGVKKWLVQEQTN